MQGNRLILAAIAATAFAVSAAPAQGAVECGDTITQSKKLKADLVDCLGKGLEVDGADIVLDLNGHLIDGATQQGIHVLEGSSDVTIKDGRIRDSVAHGILVDLTGRVKLRDIKIIRGGNRGIQVNDSSGVSLKRVRVSGAAGAGIYLSGVDGGSLSEVGVENVGGYGLDLTGISDLTVEMSTIIGGEDNEDDPGIGASGVEDSSFENLLIAGFGLAGVSFFSEDGGNRFLAVDSNGNGAGFEIQSGSVNLKEVNASQNLGDGLFVGAAATDVKTTKGKFNRNDGNGILYDVGATGSVGNNVANNNDVGGIIVPIVGVTDLGGNSASGNGTDQCLNVEC